MELTRGKVCQPKPGFGQPGEYVLAGKCRDWLTGDWHQFLQAERVADVCVFHAGPGQVPRDVRGSQVKPDWKDAPEWANWLAMDQDGEWFWFESQPSAVSQAWYSSGRFKFAGGSNAWGESLEKRP